MKKISKCLSIILGLSLVSLRICANVSAVQLRAADPVVLDRTEETTINASDYADIGNWTPDKKNGYAHISSNATTAAEFTFTIPFSTESDNEYELSFEGSFNNLTELSSHLSRVSMKVDNGEYITINTDYGSNTATEETESQRSYFWGNSFTWRKLNNNIVLSKGIHTITFRVNEQRTVNGEVGGYFAAIGDIKLTPLYPAEVSAQGTVIPAGTYANGGWTVTNGYTAINDSNPSGTCELEIPLNVVEDPAFYSLSFEGAFNTLSTDTDLSGVKFKLDDGEYSDLIDKTNIMIGSETALEFSNTKLKEITYVNPIKLTKGHHTLYFTAGNSTSGGCCAAIGQIKLEQKNVIDAVTAVTKNDGYEMKDVTNGNPPILVSYANSGSFDAVFNIIEAGYYTISAELVADMAGDNIYISPINYALDSNTAYVLTKSNTQNLGELDFAYDGIDYFCKYKIGDPVYLAAGEHTITFSVTEPINQESTLYVTGVKRIEIMDALKIELPQEEADLKTNGANANIGSVSVLYDGAAASAEDFISLTYTSSNTAVAEVSENGVLTIKDWGKTTITATATKTGQGGTPIEMSASAALTVYKGGIYVDIIQEADGTKSVKVEVSKSLTGEKVYAAVYNGKRFKSAYVPVCESGVYSIEKISAEQGDTVKCFVWKWNGNSYLDYFYEAIDI